MRMLLCRPSQVAHLVRDEGVAGSNPATPTIFPVAPIAYADSYAGRNRTHQSTNQWMLETRHDDAFEARIALHMVAPLLENPPEALRPDYLHECGIFLRRCLTPPKSERRCPRHGSCPWKWCRSV